MPVSGGALQVAASFVTLGLAYGVWYAYSVFLVALLREFGWSRSLLAGAFSVFSLVHGGLGLPLGWLADRVGPRRLILGGGVVLAGALGLVGAIREPWHLYLAFGLLTSLGVSLAGWVPAVVLIQRWFPRRVGTAIGVASAGIGAGILVVVPLCQWLIDRVGWRWTLRALGVVVACWVIPAALWLVRDAPPSAPAPRARAAPEPVAGADGMTLWRAAGTLPFWLLGTLQASTAFTNQLLLVHQVAYLVDHAIPAMAAASVVGVVGAASVAGKVGGGWASDVVGRRMTYTIGNVFVSASVGALGWLALSPGLPVAYLYGVLVGVGYGIPAAITPALVSDLFRGRHFGAIFGALLVANAVGGSLGPWVAGRVFDATGSYAPAFAAAVAAAGIATGALWGLRTRAGAPPT